MLTINVNSEHVNYKCKYYTCKLCKHWTLNIKLLMEREYLLTVNVTSVHVNYNYNQWTCKL